MPKVSAEHRESRRAEILAAARRRFAEDGFHATSMQDILDECGLSSGAVYGYFPGKSDIVAAIAGENVSTMLDALGACAESAGITVADAVVTAVQAVRSKDQPESTARLALQVWAESARDDVLRDRFADTHERFRGIVATLIRRRHPERLAAEADAMAGAVGALVPGFILQLVLLDGDRSADFETGVRQLLGEL